MITIHEDEIRAKQETAEQTAKRKKWQTRIEVRVEDMLEELQRAILDAGGYIPSDELLERPLGLVLEMFAKNNIGLFAVWREPVDRILRDKKADQELIDRLNESIDTAHEAISNNLKRSP
jgi:hypothetical protein